MNIFVSALTTLGFISAIIGIAFLIKLLIIKATYYPSNKQNEIVEKNSKTSYIIGISMLLTFGCFALGKEIIKYDFKETIQNNKIISAEIDGIFFSQDDMKGIFNNFESTEGRNRCDSFTGFINFENENSIPVEIIRHCYEKNRYIIISKKYSIDATIGDIRTSKFDYLQKDTIRTH